MAWNCAFSMKMGTSCRTGGPAGVFRRPRAALPSVPGVRDSAVFRIPDDEFGEAVMAVVEPQAGVELDIASIRAQLRTLLADYKVPKHLDIQADLPREDSGKIFKRRLRDPHWARAGRSI